MPARRTVAKTDDAFLASLSPNAPAMKKGSKTIFDTARRIIGSVQPNLDGDGTDESDDEEQAPLAITVVPSPTRSTKTEKVRYQTPPRAYYYANQTRCPHDAQWLRLMMPFWLHFPLMLQQ